MLGNACLCDDGEIPCSAMRVSVMMEGIAMLGNACLCDDGADAMLGNACLCCSDVP